MVEIVGFSALGSVPEDYRHVGKVVGPGDGLAVGGGYVKWYEIQRVGASIAGGVTAAARAFLVAEGAAGRLEIGGELGFVILHQCGDAFWFLLVQTWRGANEVWETVYAKDGVEADFALGRQDGPHRATFCVWELSAVLHERDAWVRFLTSARDAAAVDAYLKDQYSGPA